MSESVPREDYAEWSAKGNIKCLQKILKKHVIVFKSPFFKAEVLIVTRTFN